MWLFLYFLSPFLICMYVFITRNIQRAKKNYKNIFIVYKN